MFTGLTYKNQGEFHAKLYPHDRAKNQNEEHLPRVMRNSAMVADLHRPVNNQVTHQVRSV